MSRKAAVMEQEARIISKPERVYSTAAYARLSVEDNNRAGDRESITMQKYMPEKYVEAQADMRLSGVFCEMEPWQRQESDRMSAIHEKGGRCH